MTLRRVVGMGSDLDIDRRGQEMTSLTVYRRLLQPSTGRRTRPRAARHAEWTGSASGNGGARKKRREGLERIAAEVIDDDICVGATDASTIADYLLAITRVLRD